MNILVSACLLGIDCRYCGTGCYHEDIAKLAEKHYLIPVCPEQLGGLPTPREPVELVNGFAIDKQGRNVTEQFKKGAIEVLKLAKLYHCTLAILKSNSPSCGFGKVYDGTFTGKLTDGDGITSAYLAKSRITIVNEKNYQIK
jgi:uncharacterized protein YbbK (DUF523 family)